eukprot:GHUV01042788.1.p1 GENE.GHUV01042788.1~~GHUV01042788.1.p1  ORF type:complete len:159 (-),score=29.43 GHUV01042788.1:303-779(-)
MRKAEPPGLRCAACTPVWICLALYADETSIMLYILSFCRQYHYVLQSLTLWREISNDMFKLWYLAEEDMLREGASYRLCDTGQGLNRVQSAPRLSRAMHGILGRCQAQIGSWVGSSVIHLGDHNVPNALFFLNKYTQVSLWGLKGAGSYLLYCKRWNG